MVGDEIPAYFKIDINKSIANTIYIIFFVMCCFKRTFNFSRDGKYGQLNFFKNR